MTSEQDVSKVRRDDLRGRTCAGEDPGMTDKPLSTENGVVRASDTELIDQYGQTYIRTDASARGVACAVAVGGGIGTTIGLTIGLYIGGALPL